MLASHASPRRAFIGGEFVGYSQFDVMSGAELGVHAARQAALRRRIRAL